MNRKERRREESTNRNQPQGADVNHLFQQAFSQHQSGQTQQAALLYQQILTLDPHHADALHLLGLIHLQMHNLETACDLMQLAIREKPDRLLYYLNYGNALVSVGKVEDALAQYKHIIAQEPGNAEALNNAGNALKQLYRLDESAEYFRKAIAARPDYAEAYSNYAGTLDLQGKSQEALEQLKRAITLKPDYVQAYYNYGHIGTKLDQNEAVEYYRKGLEIKPGHLPSLAKLGNLLRKMGRIAEATHCFEQAMMFDPADNYGVAVPLAQLTGKTLPDRTAPNYIYNTYANRAETWDKAVSATADYNAPALAADMVKRFYNGEKPYTLMDAGCGTGLVGELLRKDAKQMDGIDLSPDMLKIAKTKNIYDNLAQGDMVALLMASATQYDVITCVATLLHFGELTAALEASAHALRKGGLMVISLFYYDNESDPVGYASSLIEGSYVHSKSYVERVAPAAGLELVSMETPMHERDSFGKPVTGLMVALKRV